MNSSVDQSLMPGARNAIGTCLNVSTEDRVWILTDEDRRPIGNALAEAVRERAAEVIVEEMERYGDRPLMALPSSMADELRALAPTVTILAAGTRPGEIRFRLPFARFLRQELSVRHGHMIGVTSELMKSGMLADYHRVATLTFSLKERLQRAKEVRVTSELGTELLVQLDNDRFRWLPLHGLYHQQGQWGNLPEGELCTSPANVNGVLQAELLGDYFCEKYGQLVPPVAFHIENSWVTRVDHEDEALAEEVWNYLGEAVNGRRVGEFAVGTNEALTCLSGNLLQDEKFPGVHLAFGNPVPEVTGAGWGSEIHVDAITTKCSIWVDEERLMQGGDFLL